jgi:hypothetical protein
MRFRSVLDHYPTMGYDHDRFERGEATLRYADGRCVLKAKRIFPKARSANGAAVHEIEAAHLRWWSGAPNSMVLSFLTRCGRHFEDMRPAAGKVTCRRCREGRR